MYVIISILIGFTFTYLFGAFLNEKFNYFEELIEDDQIIPFLMVFMPVSALIFMWFEPIF